MKNGIKYILISNLFSLFVEISVKSLSHVPFYFIAFYRSVIVMLICVVCLRKLKISLLGNNKKLLLIRGLTGTSALVLYFITLQNLSLALAITLQYLSLLFAVLFTSILSKNVPKKLQLLSLFLSFLGVVLVHDIQISQPLIYIFMGLLSAAFSGVAYTNIGVLNKTENTLVIMLYFSVTTLILVSPYSLSHWDFSFSFQNYLILICVGISSYITQYYITKAYQSTSAIVIAPASYLSLILASFVGYFVWDESITIKMLMGMILILTGNILITVSK